MGAKSNSNYKMKKYLTVLCCFSAAAHASLFGYGTEEECNHKELTKHSIPNSNARDAVAKYCAMEFSLKNNKRDEEALKRIEKECRFNVAGARQAGYSPREIIDYITSYDRTCWQRLAK